MKVNQIQHITKDGLVKRNPRKATYNPSFYEQVILDGIDSSNYGVSANTPKEKLQFLNNTFKSEYGHEIRRVGLQNAMVNYLQGLPSSISTPFYNNEIIELAKKGGSLPQNATEKEEDKIVARYWTFMAVQILKMFRKYKVD